MIILENSGGVVVCADLSCWTALFQSIQKVIRRIFCYYRYGIKL